MYIEVYDERKTPSSHVHGTDGVLVHTEHVFPGSIPWDRCGMDFNPSGSYGIRRVKSLCAAVMAALVDYQNETKDDEVDRCFRIAADHLEAAQMFAVKGVVRHESKDCNANPCLGTYLKEAS